MRACQNQLSIKTFHKVCSSQDGSVLAIAIFCLFVLSIFGTFALNTADFEMNIASNQQQREQNFNTSEGGVYREGFHVGFAGVSGNWTWFEISDPNTPNQFLLPTGTTPGSQYDPGSDMTQAIPTTFTDTQAQQYEVWPRENLMSDTTDDKYDYSYLVTYLSPGVTPPGYNANKFSAYKFRLNGQRQVVIEIGGMKIGVKNPL